MSITLLNIGNSNTAVAESDGREIRLLRVLPTGKLTVGDLPEAGEIAAACVVPAVRERLSGRPVFWLGIEHAAPAGLKLNQVDASTLGADRLANAIELLNRPARPAAVFDFGTAITLETVAEDRSFRGGAIAPGRKLLRQSLAAITAQLPEIPWHDRAPEQAGRNTVEAIRLGVDRGAVGLVRELIHCARKEFPGLRLWAIGGDAAFFCRELPELEPGGDLFTVSGLLTAYLANR